MPTIFQNLDERLEPVVEDIIAELERDEAPYSDVIEAWMMAIRDSIISATVEYDVEN